MIPTDQNTIRDILVLYEDIDRQTLNFAKETGLCCKPGCGACCENPEIETTVAEVMPLAAHLWSQGLAEKKLESIRSNPSKSVCAFYEPVRPAKSGLNKRPGDPLTPGKGRCGAYLYRPGICRLFGFAARRDKHGQRVLVTCRIIKDTQPQNSSNAQKKLHEGLDAPLLSAHAFAVSNIDPVHGEKLCPINQAIRRALEKVGYNIQNNS